MPDRKNQRLDLSEVLATLAQQGRGAELPQMSPEEMLEMQIDLLLLHLDRYEIWKDAGLGEKYGYGSDSSKKSNLDRLADKLIAETVRKIETLAIQRSVLIEGKK